MAHDGCQTPSEVNELSLSKGQRDKHQLKMTDNAIGKPLKGMKFILITQ